MGAGGPGGLPEVTATERVAVYDRLLSDAAGNLWIRRTPLPGERTHRYDVYAPDGGFRASLSLPGELTVLYPGRDRILLHRRDDLDVEHVELYPILKG